MTTTAEAILIALATALDNGTTAKFARNASVPEKIPAKGLIILRDGNPGAADETLGGFDPVYYEHEVEIEIYVAHGKQETRDEKFDDLIAEIGVALENNPDLGGLIFGMTYSRPDIAIEIIPGSDAVKSGVIDLTLEYETPTPLS